MYLCHNDKINIKLEKKRGIGLIYNQKDYPVCDMMYGDSKIKDTGCELVAIYLKKANI